MADEVEPQPPPVDPELIAHQRQMNRERSLHLHQAATDRSKFVIDFALLGLRTLTLLNGGAILALLTFLGNHSDVAVRRGAWDGFVWLLVGLSLSMIAILCAYLSQQFFNNQENAGATKIWFAAYGGKPEVVSEAERDEDKSHKSGRFWQTLAVVVALGSFASFGMGCGTTLAALIPQNETPAIPATSPPPPAHH